MSSPGGGSTVRSEPVTTTTTSQSAPWRKQRPYLVRGFEAAERDILNRPLEFFPDQTYVPYSPETEQALGMQQQRALGGSPLLGLAQSDQARTLGGQYLFNPYYNPVAEAIRAEVQPMVSQQFAAANRQGSPLQAEATARGITRGLAPFAFQDFRQGRTEMERAAAMAPSLAREDYFDIGELAKVGAAREAMAGQQLADEMARFEFAQMEPYYRLPAYKGLIEGQYGGTTTGTTTGQQYFPRQTFNPLLFGLGAATSLAGAGAGLFGPFGPWGAGGAFGGSPARTPPIFGGGLPFG